MPPWKRRPCGAVQRVTGIHEERAWPDMLLERDVALMTLHLPRGRLLTMQRAHRGAVCRADHCFVIL